MTRQRSTLGVLALLLLVSLFLAQTQSTLRAQGPPAGLVTNPRAIEFDLPDRTVRFTAYKLELFRAGADTQAAQPDWVVKVGAPDGVEASGPIRIDLTKALKGVPNGQYVATLRGVSGNRESARSAPTALFAVNGLGGGSPPDRGLPRGSSAAPPPSGADPMDPRQAAGPERRVWKIVGVVIGAAVLLGPLLLR